MALQYGDKPRLFQSLFQSLLTKRALAVSPLRPAISVFTGLSPVARLIQQPRNSVIDKRYVQVWLIRPDYTDHGQIRRTALLAFFVNSKIRCREE